VTSTLFEPCHRGLYRNVSGQPVVESDVHDQCPDVRLDRRRLKDTADVIDLTAMVGGHSWSVCLARRDPLESVTDSSVSSSFTSVQSRRCCGKNADSRRRARVAGVCSRAGVLERLSVVISW